MFLLACAGNLFIVCLLLFGETMLHGIQVIVIVLCPFFLISSTICKTKLFRCHGIYAFMRCAHLEPRVRLSVMCFSDNVMYLERRDNNALQLIFTSLAFQHTTHHTAPCIQSISTLFQWNYSSGYNFLYSVTQFRIFLVGCFGNPSIVCCALLTSLNNRQLVKFCWLRYINYLYVAIDVTLRRRTNKRTQTLTHKTNMFSD